MMDIDTAKGICLGLLFLISLVFGCCPYLLVRGDASNHKSIKIRELIISYLNCFSGGVFMSVCLVDMMPEGLEAMGKYFEMADVDTSYPAFMVVTAAGFFIIALVELLAHSLMHKFRNRQQKYEENYIKHDSAQAPNDTEEGHFGCSNNVSFDNEDRQRPDLDGGKIEACNAGNLDQEKPESQEMELTYMRKQSKTELMVGGNSPVSAENGGHGEFKDTLSAISGNPLRAFLLLAALSFHTVFDGLAVGLKTTEMSVWRMFSASAIHKALVSLCLGLQIFLVYKDRPVKGLLWTVFFATIAPIGIGIGMGLTSGEMDETARQLISTLLQGLTTGTFLYVTFFEILKDELTNNRGLLRLFTVVVGFSVMALIIYFDGDDD